MNQERIPVTRLAMGQRFELEDLAAEFRVINIVDEAGPRDRHNHRVAVAGNDWGILAFVFGPDAEVLQPFQKLTCKQCTSDDIRAEDAKRRFVCNSCGRVQ